MVEIQEQFTAWVNDIVQKKEDVIICEMKRYLTEKGYAEVFEINGANLISAIEKQTPKKPVIVRFLNVNYPQCPICKRTLWKSSENYCATCGQKIDWSE